MKKREIFSVLITVIVLAAVCSTAAIAAPFQYGDVFAAVGNGQIDHYDSTGTYIETLDTGLGGSTSGMTFDSAQNLYVTDWSASAVSKFDKSGTLIGTFGSGYYEPESILFDSSGNAYVGSNLSIRKFDSAGNFLASYGLNAPWIELLPDQCTMLYTNFGSAIQAHNVCTDTALGQFDLGHGTAYALRRLAYETTLVADSTEVLRMDSDGYIYRHYSGFGAGLLSSLNLDPDGTSFWTGDYNNGHFYKVDIAFGTVLMDVDTGKGPNQLYGLVVSSEGWGPGSISGMKFNDINCNGFKNDGDNGLIDWTIELDDDFGATYITTTAADGSYSFDNLPAGNYRVFETPQDGWTQTAPSSLIYTITLVAGQRVTGKDFGNVERVCNDFPIPEFPSSFLPATMITGFLGAVLLIQRTREY
jgi:hypothetical protein